MGAINFDQPCYKVNYLLNKLSTSPMSLLGSIPFSPSLIGQCPHCPPGLKEVLWMKVTIDAIQGGAQ